MVNQIKVSDFLMQELAKIGIDDVFGVPGDYNFNVITSVLENSSLKWIGCTNELNAGYAADGYARIKGLGAIITTFNVGELSALNAIAGSFAENVPVISIVGYPPTNFIEKNALVHHSYSEPDYESALRIAKNAASATTILTKENAKTEIERVLAVFLQERKPVYIGIPVDVCDAMIDNNSELKMPESNQKNLNEAVDNALKLIEDSKKPVIIGGCLADRFQSKELLQKFAAKAGFPVTTMAMGKGLINEDEPNFAGTYLGSIDNQNVYNMVQDSDCKISIGTIYNDFNTVTDLNFNPKDYIEVTGTKVTVDGIEYKDVLMKDFLEKLTDKIKETKPVEISKSATEFEPMEQEEKPLDFNYFLPRMEKFFKENDRIFTDTGYLDFSIQSLTLPKGCQLYEQLLWCSIGWATPAVVGACQADRNTRTILLTGEGSHQLTVQSLSNMGYLGLKPIIFVLNNSGYSIERTFSKDENAKYNDIIPWDYTKIMNAFVPDAYTAKVKTNHELEKVLEEIESESNNKICYVELFMDKFAEPPLIHKIKEHKIEMNG